MAFVHENPINNARRIRRRATDAFEKPIILVLKSGYQSRVDPIASHRRLCVVSATAFVQAFERTNYEALPTLQSEFSRQPYLL